MPTMPEPHFFAVIRRVFGWMALLVGGGLVVGSLFVLSGRWAWHARSTTAIGEVVAHRSVAGGSAGAGAGTGMGRGAGTGTAFRRSGARATHAEVVRFTDARGTTHEFVSGVSTSFAFEVGEKVPVRYIEGEARGASSDAAADPVPDAAIDAVIDTWFRVWGLPVIFTGAGALFLGFGAVAVVARRRVH